MDCFYVVTLNRLYLTQWSIGSISLDRDLQRAFKYLTLRDAEFVAKKVGGEVLTCRNARGRTEVIRG